jgi:hypothetical protein
VDEDVADEMNRSIVEQVATYPVATSSGGFTYEFDPSLGIARRNTRSFGPAFTERAMTVGARNISFGINVQHARFDRFGDKHLTHFRLAESEDPEFQFVRNLDLTIDTDTTAFVSEIGVLPRLDVGVVVPFINVRMHATMANMPAGAVPIVIARAGSSSGLGDVIIKTKYKFHQGGGGGWAAAADLRLPSGDFLNLRGAGHSLLKVYGIGSVERGAFAPHVNAGITMPTRSLAASVPFPLAHAPVAVSEINYSGGADVIAGPRLTIIADAIGRTRRHALILGDFTDPDGPSTYFTLLNSGNDPVTQVLGSVGVKINVHRTLLINVSALVPVYSRRALAAHLATVVGFDYAF